MTWLKLSDDFGEKWADLSDAAFRTHAEALGWTMRRETGGALRLREVARLAESPDWHGAVEELVGAGYWEACDNGYVIVEHMEHQPEPEVLVARRRNDAERQRRKRRKAAGLDTSPPDSRPKSRRDTPSDNPRDPGRVGSEREATLKPALEQEEVKEPRSDTCRTCGRLSGFSLLDGRCRRCLGNNRQAS